MADRPTRLGDEGSQATAIDHCSGPGHRAWCRLALGLLLAVVFGFSSHPAFSQSTSFRAYGQAEGLTNLTARCLRQDGTGYLYLCTEHGFYTYDGRRFSNLGPEQGLPEGGTATGVVFGRSGQVILLYPFHVYVSKRSTDLDHGPRDLDFTEALPSASSEPQRRFEAVVPWHTGAIVLDDGHLSYLDPGNRDRLPRLEPFDHAFGALRTGERIASIYSVSADVLWMITTASRICRLSNERERCLGPADGVPVDDWSTMAANGGRLYIRSTSRLATVSLSGGRVSLVPLDGLLPIDHDITSIVLMAPAPGGKLVTVSGESLVVGNASGWTPLNAANAVPTYPAFAALFDNQQNLWVSVAGHGLLRALGYGVWENSALPKKPPENIIWQISRQPGGPLWLATQAGLTSRDPALPPTSPLRPPTAPGYAVLVGANGHVWFSVSTTTIARMTLATGRTLFYPLPRVNRILQGHGSQIWFLTEHGLYTIDATSDDVQALHPVPTVPGAVGGGVVAPDGTLWVFQKRRLLHVKQDGSLVAVPNPWSQASFEPLVIALASSGELWVGGSGAGLQRLTIIDDRVVRRETFDPPDILSNTIVSLVADHRGWIWAGTDRGLSVYDGRSWVSATTDTGLVWNDLNQDSLIEDEDGTMWIGTSQGLSHLLDPIRLFEGAAPRPVISSMQLGAARLGDRAVPYSRAPLVIQFGALDFQSDGVNRFRYRLQGVDQGWVEADGDSVRYPTIPPGDHRFQLVAYNPLTHQSSMPISVTIRMQRPWWEWWPMVGPYAAVVAGLLYAVVKLRDWYVERRRAALQRAVEAGTQELRAAQAIDSLTRLFTRGEIQRRLLAVLADPTRPFQPVIGLLDVDHFKRINDRFGHLAGDEILEEIGRRLLTALGEEEYAGRYGGEEILIVLAKAGPDALDRIVDLRRAICERPFEIDLSPLSVTCSVGTTRAGGEDDWATLIGRADKALYEAKANGRDRVVVAKLEVSL